MNILPHFNVSKYTSTKKVSEPKWNQNNFKDHKEKFGKLCIEGYIHRHILFNMLLQNNMVAMYNSFSIPKTFRCTFSWIFKSKIHNCLLKNKMKFIFRGKNMKCRNRPSVKKHKIVQTAASLCKIWYLLKYVMVI